MMGMAVGLTSGIAEGLPTGPGVGFALGTAGQASASGDCSSAFCNRVSENG